MTLAAACGWSLIRSLVVAVGAWPVCRWLCCRLDGMPGRQRRLAWLVLVVPFVCPELWTGYAWSGFGLRLANSGFWSIFPAAIFPQSPQWIVARDAAADEILLLLLLFLRAVPVGSLAAYFAPPPPLSPAAIYCRELALGQPSRATAATSGEHGTRRADGPLLQSMGHRLVFALRGRLHAALPAIGLMFLVSFQEFELASLVGRPAWTVWLFDAQVGGLALRESLRLAILPVVCQLVVLVPLLGFLATGRAPSAPRRAWGTAFSARTPIGFWLWALGAITMTCLIPLWLVGQDTLTGLARILRNGSELRTLLKEILIGSGYAVVAATASAFVAALLLHAGRIWRPALAAALAGALPGLFGSLVLSLALIKLFQQPFISGLYKSPLALAGGLVLFLLPRAVLLRLLLWSSRRAGSLHLARLLGESPSRHARGLARELAWQLRWRGEFWSVALLSYWGFLDLTIAYLLAPVTMVSAPVMLYNQMHFGKNAILAARVLLTVLVPGLLFASVSGARRFLFRWFWR